MNEVKSLIRPLSILLEEEFLATNDRRFKHWSMRAREMESRFDSLLSSAKYESERSLSREALLEKLEKENEELKETQGAYI